jgi:hypothetical protein
MEHLTEIDETPEFLSALGREGSGIVARIAGKNPDRKPSQTRKARDLARPKSPAYFEKSILIE